MTARRVSSARLLWAFLRFDAVRTACLALLFAMAVLATCSLAPAQTVRVENMRGDLAFSGWKRATIDRLPPHPVGYVLTQPLPTPFVVGRQVGLETWVVDVRVNLAPGQALALDLAQSVRNPTWERPSLPANPAAFFGGMPSIRGAAMELRTVAPDGAGYTAHWRCRTGPMLHTDLWCTWIPGQPWAHGEVLVTASNPSVPDLFATVPAGTDLRFGNAIVTIPGAPAGGAGLLPAGTVFADGQARLLPVTFLWPSQLASVAEINSWAVAKDLGVGAVGIAKLLADGNPTYPSGFSARGWATANLPGCIARLHDWGALAIGPAAASGSAGEQEDSAFSRGEALLPGGVGCELVTYLAALRLAARPCHHREADGSLLNPALHTGKPLIMWDGRPSSPLWGIVDRLGKSAPIGPDQCAGWWGPDVEHAMFATLAAGARLTGSPALQSMLRQLAVLYPLQWTTQAGWATSDTFAARAVGWEGILAVHLWRDLEDRGAAARTKAHWLDRLDRVLLPALSQKPYDIHDVRVDDPRLGAGARWIPWQAALEAYGLDLPGAQFGRADARALALRVARRVLADAWKLGADGRWKSCASGLLATPGGDGAPFDESFNHYGMPLAACVVLRHASSVTADERAKAAAILAQVRASATEPKHLRWIAPGVPQ